MRRQKRLKNSEMRSLGYEEAAEGVQRAIRCKEVWCLGARDRDGVPGVERGYNILYRYGFRRLGVLLSRTDSELAPRLYTVVTSMV